MIRRTLEGIFGFQAGMDVDSAMEAFRNYLKHLPLLEGIPRELTEAFSDGELSWQKLLDECYVGAFGCEKEAEEFVRRTLLRTID
ncbi:hypothetical protein [Achromobacter sp. MFA1 R4]|uniref:hypothetical protein n=1 Tax=Achromobacter sp. MFA1 R4 TaxID=1881016 RepID=UPI0012EC8EEC|nr:hypothetical protein [Achromobacter sp. MFA1 R4]